MKELTRVDETWLNNRTQCALLAHEMARQNDEGKGAKIANLCEWTQLSDLHSSKKCVIAALRAQLIIRKQGCWYKAQ